MRVDFYLHLMHFLVTAVNTGCHTTRIYLIGFIENALSAHAPILLLLNMSPFVR